MVRLQRLETLEATPGNCTPSPCSLAAAQHAIRWKSGQVMPLSRSGDVHAIALFVWHASCMHTSVLRWPVSFHAEG